MNTSILSGLVVTNFLLGALGVVMGFITTFDNPGLGWGMIAGGILCAGNFYYLVWGVEEALKDDE